MLTVVEEQCVDDRNIPGVRSDPAVEAFKSWGTSSRRGHPRFCEHHHFSMRLLDGHGFDRRGYYFLGKC